MAIATLTAVCCSTETLLQNTGLILSAIYCYDYNVLSYYYYYALAKMDVVTEVYLLF